MGDAEKLRKASKLVGSVSMVDDSDTQDKRDPKYGTIQAFDANNDDTADKQLEKSLDISAKVADEGRERINTAKVHRRVPSKKDNFVRDLDIDDKMDVQIVKVADRDGSAEVVEERKEEGKIGELTQSVDINVSSEVGVAELIDDKQKSGNE